jgi:hypothetical protein
MRFSRRQMVLGPLALGAIGLSSSAAADPRGRSDRRTGPPYTDQDRRRATLRGLRFIHATARVPANFAQHGEDYLWCFHTIASTAADPDLAQLARRMGLAAARAWRRLHPVVPADVPAGDITWLAYGSRTADLLGVPDRRMHEALRRAAEGYGAADFLDFDPARELPPADVPDTCTRCLEENERGLTRCSTCGNALDMKSPYGVLMDALIATCMGDRYGVRLGAGYADVAALVPRMRPYRGYEGGNNPEFTATAYAVTHIVYTLNDYGTWRLDPAWLPQELAFLRANLEAGLALRDPELLGEYLDCLKAFGVPSDNALVRAGVDFLMAAQNRDGSWGHVQDSDIYQRYHSTWTAVDGLRDFAFRGEGTSFPEALERLKG